MLTTITTGTTGRVIAQPTPLRLIRCFLAAAAASRLSASARAIATLSWQTVTLALCGLSVWDSLGMIAFGDAVFASPSFTLARSVPGGARALGLTLGLLLAFIAYAWGQHRLGHSRLLRRGLALLAGWQVGWAVMLAAVSVTRWQAPSWRALGVGAFIAFMATLAARATPPDRG